MFCARKVSFCFVLYTLNNYRDNKNNVNNITCWHLTLKQNELWIKPII